MIFRINDRYNIDILYDTEPVVGDLFLKILKVFPVPMLSQVNVLSVNLPAPQPIAYTPFFPFFNYVATLMDKLVEQSHEEANIDIDILAEEGSASQLLSIGSKKTVLDILEDAVCSRTSKLRTVSLDVHVWDSSILYTPYILGM